MMELYDNNAFDCSRVTANNYSTSFSFGIRLFKKKFRPAIYAIYGFVRFADEIVDTFHDKNQEDLLKKLSEDTRNAIESGFSSNPILHSFQKTVNDYSINNEYIKAFLRSMEMDLTYKRYNSEDLREYIYGSAEVVGLMCLKVFYKNREKEFDKLVYYARKLGEAFQKINFLRDIRSDFLGKGRVYFPGLDPDNFKKEEKSAIEKDIEYDFSEAKKGISQLHNNVRLGVYLAFRYYLKLLKKIKKTTPDKILNKRYRISGFSKVILLLQAWIRHQLGII